jgi:hypothetical protein
LLLKELTTKRNAAQFDIMQHTNFSLEKYESYDQMVAHNYIPNRCFEGDVCVGLSGLWFGIKLWCGKYLEIDNFIVHPAT